MKNRKDCKHCQHARIPASPVRPYRCSAVYVDSRPAPLTTRDKELLQRFRARNKGVAT